MLAHRYGRGLTTGLCIEDIERWPEDIRAVGARQVHEAVRNWLDKKRAVTGYLIKESTPRHWEKL
ncbi:putative Zn-dependent peptidase [Bradyrhizobium ottawaense]